MQQKEKHFMMSGMVCQIYLIIFPGTPRFFGGTTITISLTHHNSHFNFRKKAEQNNYNCLLYVEKYTPLFILFIEKPRRDHRSKLIQQGRSRRVAKESILSIFLL